MPPKAEGCFAAGVGAWEEAGSATAAGISGRQGRGSVLHHWRGNCLRRGGLHRFRRVLRHAALLKRLYALAQPGDLLLRRRTAIKPDNRKHGRNQQRKNKE